MGQALIKLSLVLLMGFGSTLIYQSWKKSSDPCKTAQLQTSQTEISAKDKNGLKLHLAFGFGKKLKKYFRYVKSVETKTYFKPRYKLKPSMVSLTTEFKTQKSANSAYKFLKRKWESKKDQGHEVVQQGKSVIWYRNSNANNQCFAQAVAVSKRQLGIEETSPKKQIAKAK